MRGGVFTRQTDTSVGENSADKNGANTVADRSAYR